MRSYTGLCTEYSKNIRIANLKKKLALSITRDKRRSVDILLEQKQSWYVAYAISL